MKKLSKKSTVKSLDENALTAVDGGFHREYDDDRRRYYDDDWKRRHCHGEHPRHAHRES